MSENEVFHAINYDGITSLHGLHVGDYLELGVCRILNIYAGACGGGGIGPWPPLRSLNFTLDIGLSQKKVCQRRSIGRKTRVGPPLARFLNTPLYVCLFLYSLDISWVSI